MLMSLGDFVFEVNTAPFETHSHSASQRIGSNNRYNQRPAQQHTGQGDETRTINGTIYPCHTGGASNLNTLNKMADTGEASILVTGTGDILGWYLIKKIDQNHSHLTPDGISQKITFTLDLVRTDEPRL